jgi:hypothetical protein
MPNAMECAGAVSAADREECRLQCESGQDALLAGMASPFSIWWRSQFDDRYPADEQAKICRSRDSEEEMAAAAPNA